MADAVADGDDVRSVIVSVPDPSEVVSGSARSVRTGASSGSSVVTNAVAATAETAAAPSAHAGASTTTSNTRSHPRVRSSRRSDRSTANAHRSKANATNSAAEGHQTIRISYATMTLYAPQRGSWMLPAAAREVIGYSRLYQHYGE